jgi:putative ABC transport system permease protein
MLVQDVRYTLRMLWKNRAFTTIALVCLAIGIGLNATIFAVVDGVLIQSFPYTEPDRIVILTGTHQRSGIQEGGVSYADLRDWKAHTTAFTTIAGTTGRSLTISDGREPERYRGALISWDLFALLGTTPYLGRGFTADDDRPGAAPVVLLGHEVWMRRYLGDPAVIGRRILVNTQPHTIVGVMPPGFEFPDNRQLWVAAGPIIAPHPRAARELFTFARLKPGVTMDTANQELGALAGRLAAQYPDTNEGWSTRVQPLRDEFIPDDVELVIWLMMGAVTLVLLIACANVANLLIARATVRRREIALRMAIGAGRARIVRQLLTEGVILGLLSVPLGLAIAAIGVRLLDASIPADQIPYYIHWRLDWRSASYTIVVAIVTALVFALVPALQAVRGRLHESLKEGGRGSSGGSAWARNILVVGEVALSLVLLVAASLFVRTFVNLNDYAIGFDPKPLMAMRFFMAGKEYEAEDAVARRVEDVVRRIEALPEVQAVFASNMAPLEGGGDFGPIIVDGRTVTRGDEPTALFTGVTPGFVRTMNVPIVRGRDFTSAEGLSKTPVALINATMARRLWPDGDPVGRRFRMRDGAQSTIWFTIVGVVSDVKHDDVDPDDDQLSAAYVPYRYQQMPNTALTIRVVGDPAHITGAARREIRASDANLPVFGAQTVDASRRLGFWQYELFSWMFSIFGVMAVLLASIGVYGMVSYAVSQRTQEIGVRVALGAERRDVLRLVVSQGLRLAGAGVLVGIVGAVGLTRFMKTLLYNVAPTDPLSFGAVALFLLAVAFAASYVPARRATTVDPLIALRSE